MKIYLISAKNGEFIGFTDKGDARYVATGNTSGCFGVPSVGEAFREAYAEGSDDYDEDEDEVVELPMFEIGLTPAQVKAAKIRKSK